MSPQGTDAPSGAEHRIAAGNEARRAEEPAVATPKMICALKGRHNRRNTLHDNDLDHSSALPGRGHRYRHCPRVRAFQALPRGYPMSRPWRGFFAAPPLDCQRLRQHGNR